MQMLLESSVFRTQQVTKTPCATAVVARERAREASAGHVRGPLMNYKNDGDYIEGGRIGVDIARRGTRLFLFFFPKFFFSKANGGSVNVLRIRLSTYPSFFYIFFPKKSGFAEIRCHHKKRLEKPERVVRGLTPGSKVSGFSSAPGETR